MITVFTPTYNRGYIINKLYESLKKQTNKDFEWLVVDDGSTDNTQEIFNNIILNEKNFPVRYIKKQNGGKHRAINRGVLEARGNLFFIVDSDDFLSCDAIEKIYGWVSSIGKDHKYAGVSGCRGHFDSTVIGGKGIGGGYVDATNLERKKKNLLGDKAEVYFTEVLKKYPFPEFDGENFITEEVVWNKIAADGYYLRWFSDVIYFTEYLPDGLTKSKNLFGKNPQGTLYWAKRQLEYFRKNFKAKLGVIRTYYCAVHSFKRDKEIAVNLGISRFKLNFVKMIVFLKGDNN